MPFEPPINPLEPLKRVLANAYTLGLEEARLHSALRDAATRAYDMANQMDARGTDEALDPDGVRARFSAALRTLRRAYCCKVDGARRPEQWASQEIDRIQLLLATPASGSSEEWSGPFEPVDWAGQLEERQQALRAIRCVREEYEGLACTVEEVESLVTGGEYEPALAKLAAIRDWHAQRASSPDFEQDDQSDQVGSGTGSDAKLDGSESRQKLQEKWKPPRGYVGTKTICHDARFRKNGKNPQPSTIQRWVERAARHNEPVEIVRAPDTHENFYPEAWIAKQIKRWSPRSTWSSVRVE